MVRSRDRGTARTDRVPCGARARGVWSVPIELREGWTDFQLDGYGTWLWALEGHRRRHNRSIEPYLSGAALSARYVAAFWGHASYDWWEEHPDHRHTSTLASLWAGLRAAASWEGLGSELRDLCDATAGRIRDEVLRDARRLGYLPKWIGGDAVDDRSALFPVETPLAEEFLRFAGGLFGIGRRGLVHPSLARVHPVHGTPVNAILLVSGVTVVASFLGDAALVPITEVGSLAAGVGWLSAALAFLARERRSRHRTSDPALRQAQGVVSTSNHGHRIPDSGPRTSLWLPWLAAAVSLAIILMKVLPPVPGSFTGDEWTALALWSALGLGFWIARRR